MYARILAGMVQEVIDFAPGGRFTAEIAALFEPVPDGTAPGATRNGDGSFTAPAPPVAPSPPAPPIPPLDPADTTFQEAPPWQSLIA